LFKAKEMIQHKEAQVILVNEKDEWIGTLDKTTAHTEGVLHRALSVFIFNDKRELLLQQRALDKYHSGGLWSNACCSHPYPGESTLAAAHRRLQEELGFDCELCPVLTHLYKADVGKGMIEHEYDHIFSGYYNGSIEPQPAEVSHYRYVSLPELHKEMIETPEQFTQWFHILLPVFLEAQLHY
jgi:isopentenyl-diphosphate delta-isomerase